MDGWMIPYLDQIPTDSFWQQFSFLLYIALGIAAITAIRILVKRLKPKEAVTIGAVVTGKLDAAKNVALFQAGDGSRLKLQVPYEIYGQLSVGDRGRLTYLGKQLLQFAKQ
jgi:hypothetical protein